MNPARRPKEIRLTHWSEFEPALERIRKALSERQTEFGPKFGATLFRGHGNSTWKLQTTLEREHPNERSLLKYYRKASGAKPHIETFSGKRWDKLPTFPEFEQSLKDNVSWVDLTLSNTSEFYEYLVYLRHRFFPSPLLDWTASPYVAAFFAFDEVDERAKRVSIHAVLRGPFGAGSSEKHYEFVGPYMRTDPRHLLQQSHYSWCMDIPNQQFKPHEEAIWDAVGAKGEVFKITIPVSERRTALEHLDLMNINRFSLFGSEDSLVRTIARCECEFKDWNL